MRSSAAIAPGLAAGGPATPVIDASGTFWRYSGLSVLGQRRRRAGRRRSAAGSGRPRTGDTYAMFYLFSMEEQQATLDLVRQALLLGGLAMVLMVGGVAWLVSRQVLEPGAAGPPDRRAVRVAAASSSGCTSAARTTSPG